MDTGAAVMLGSFAFFSGSVRGLPAVVSNAKWSSDMNCTAG